eukprot:scaffold78524_cov16-Prasinocladus_malaysianus.AAC.1
MLTMQNAKLAKEVERLHGEAGSAQKESVEARDLREKVRRLEVSLAEAQGQLKVRTHAGPQPHSKLSNRGYSWSGYTGLVA